MGIFHSIVRWFAGLWLRLQGFVRDNVRPAIILVETIKYLVDSPTADVVAAMTQTPIDDAILASLRRYLPRVLSSLIVTEKCSALPTAEAQLACYVAEIRQLSPDRQQSLYLKLASKLAQLRAKVEEGRPVSQVQADSLTQLAYSHDKSKGRLLPYNGLQALPSADTLTPAPTL